jgi:hypothetical protein
MNDFATTDVLAQSGGAAETVRTGWRPLPQSGVEESGPRRPINGHAPIEVSERASWRDNLIYVPSPKTRPRSAFNETDSGSPRRKNGAALN